MSVTSQQIIDRVSLNFVSSACPWRLCCHPEYWGEPHFVYVAFVYDTAAHVQQIDELWWKWIFGGSTRCKGGGGGWRERQSGCALGDQAVVVSKFSSHFSFETKFRKHYNVLPTVWLGPTGNDRWAQANSPWPWIFVVEVRGRECWNPHKVWLSFHDDFQCSSWDITRPCCSMSC